MEMAMATATATWFSPNRLDYFEIACASLQSTVSGLQSPVSSQASRLSCPGSPISLPLLHSLPQSRSLTWPAPHLAFELETFHFVAAGKLQIATQLVGEEKVRGAGRLGRQLKIHYEGIGIGIGIDRLVAFYCVQFSCATLKPIAVGTINTRFISCQAFKWCRSRSAKEEQPSQHHHHRHHHHHQRAALPYLGLAWLAFACGMW